MKKKPNPPYQSRTCENMRPEAREKHIRIQSAKKWNGIKRDGKLGRLSDNSPSLSDDVDYSI